MFEDTPVNSTEIPKFHELIIPVIKALQTLGGSGTNNEISNMVIKEQKLPDNISDFLYAENSKSVFEDRVAWARTYLRKFGLIDRSGRGIWFLKDNNINSETIDVAKLIKSVRSTRRLAKRTEKQKNTYDLPEEIDNEEGWQNKLYNILTNMDAFAFERLSQMLLKECGFTNVEVTKKTGDGGIDGTGKLKINGIFSFNIAFQCKRYKDTTPISPAAIRDFRGSLTTDIEKGVFITTGKFSRAAIEEASNPGKQQIDLMDGDEFIAKMAEFGLGLKAVTTYEIDEEYFLKI